jgi:hypothetical protein
VRRLMVAIAAAIASALILGATLAGADSPTVTIENASSVSYSSAVAKGTVDPKGKTTYCHFEYVSQAQLEQNLDNGGGEFDGAPAPDCNDLPRNGTGSQDVETTLTGLTPGTVYHLRLLANNDDGLSEAVAASTFETDPVGKPTVTIDPVTTFTGTTAHFSGSINPNASGSDPFFKVNWHFECSPGCPGAEGPALGTANTPQSVEADATGLEPNTDYEVKLIASDPGGEDSAGPVSFKTQAVGPEAQTIPAFALADGTSALVGGKVNPHNTATTWWVEYGTTTGYGKSEPATKDAAAGSGGQSKVLSEEIGGLLPGTLYHYRLVAKSSAGETPGEDMTFKTPSAAPQQPAPGSCSNEQFRVGPSAALPDCRAYELVSAPGLTGDVWPPGNASPDGNALLWGTFVVRPGFPGVNGGEDLYVSRRGPDGWTDKHVGLGNEVGGVAPMVHAAPDLKRFIFGTYAATLPGDDGPNSPTAIIDRDLYREEPDGTFAHINQGSDPQPAEEENNLGLAGTTPDGMKVLFGDERILEPGAAVPSFYLRVGNTTEIVSRDENNVPVSAGSATNAGSAKLSEDGSTAAFIHITHGFGEEASVYIRDLEAGHSILVATEVPEPGVFPEINLLALSPAGTRLLFSAHSQLTPDDEDSSTDLYEYNRDTEALTRLTTGSPGSGNADTCGASDCRPRFVTATKDGSEVYFISAEQLDADKGVEGDPNLYLHAGGHTTYVTTLTFAPGDDPLAGSPSRLMLDESTLLFEASSRITAYDSAGHNEIYAYDSKTGRITCVSCRPDGTAPSGDADLRGGPSVFGEGDLRLASSNADGSYYYYATSDPLVPGDTNGHFDVYEYNTASATPLLISDGKSDSDATYWGNSNDGRDIFIHSRQPLNAEDPDDSVTRVYDARIGGGFPTPVKPPSCEGEGCRGQGSAPPAPAAPTTSSFEGPPNPKPGKPKKHKKKHKKHAKHKSQKRNASHNGRTGR